MKLIVDENCRKIWIVRFSFKYHQKNFQKITGKINFDEFLHEMLDVPVEKSLEKEKSSLEKEVKFTPEQVKMYSDFFKQCDQDENGFLDKGKIYLIFLTIE